MEGYEIPKRLGYPRTVFYEDGIVFYYKDGSEVSVKTGDIERIEYARPSLWNYLTAWFGTYPGRMEIYLSGSGNALLGRADNKRLYLVKISEKYIYGLPEFYKRKMGLYN